MARYPNPTIRRLRVYAFDPQASVTLATAMINDFTIELPWEERWEAPLEPGPVNDYVEVIDHDPAAGVFYAPVDLDDPALLAQDGLDPSEGRPQFHQQMVFAVVMRTIRAFERALGRVVLWAGDPADSRSSDPIERNFTRRLRIHPHALREPNAYYSPAKRALLFGYFKPLDGAVEVQASWVFTCLSQDVIAHETTHAILHGLRQRSIEPSNPDALAFHEAFADIVAMLQHFAMPNVVRDLLGASGGSLREPSLLTGLADQFGRATGRNGALRYALRALEGRAGARQDNSAESIGAAIAALRDATEPHERGGFLVAAVFDAFVTIYERRTADLHRMSRSAHAAPGVIDPDLLARLAGEAAKSAEHVMRMCIRALDYTPPVDLRYGEYLRAIVSADVELVRNDPLRYRIAFIEAFRRWGITVPGCISMAPDSLVWDPPDLRQCNAIVRMAGEGVTDPADALSAHFTDLLRRLHLGVTFGGDDATFAEDDFAKNGRNLRESAMRTVLANQRAIHDWFVNETPADEDWERLVGLRLLPEGRSGIFPPEWGFTDAAPLRSLSAKMKGDDWSKARPNFAIDVARLARRTGPDGFEMHMLIFQITQRRRGYFSKREQEAADAGDRSAIGAERWAEPDFWFRGGATLHVDLRDGRLLRIIRKRIDNADRLEEERKFRSGEATGIVAGISQGEPFAFLHRCG